MHKQAKANDINLLAAFAFLNFLYLNNGVMKTPRCMPGTIPNADQKKCLPINKTASMIALSND